jgi:hypothetical protein
MDSSKARRAKQKVLNKARQAVVSVDEPQPRVEEKKGIGMKRETKQRSSYENQTNEAIIFPPRFIPSH